jgi:cyclopropane-fatty-acyl-phospholipid synthase
MLTQLRLNAWSGHLRRHPSVPLRVELWNGQRIDLSDETPRVTLRVTAPSALRYLLSPSLYSLGRAYVEGQIEVQGRTADMIHVVTALSAATQPMYNRLAALLPSMRHTRKLDAEAIRYHYDVSNEFYAAWLDSQMVYSCAYFERGDETLDQAQLKKIDHILTKLAVRPGHTLLDIGCGWGALVLRAATRFGARCLGITLSDNQARLARERVARAGLQDRIEIRVQDYRDVDGQFDRITSVGMFEHVGRRHLPEYFRRMRALLGPDGMAMNHGITTSDVQHRPTRYGGGQFIGRYVFPHGELAHIGTVLTAMQEGGLEALDVENLRRHYARTCQLWSERFDAASEQINRLTDARRYRIWRVYLAGCQHAFAQDWISLYQIVCAHGGRPATELPWSRRYMYGAALGEPVNREAARLATP